MAFGVIIIGDEILSGRRVDKHLPKVIELLTARGLSLGWAEYIGDEPERITATLRRSFASGDIVFSTGGIGATPDDHTRQCAAAALGVPLELHPEAAELIRERIRDTHRPVRPTPWISIRRTIVTVSTWARIRRARRSFRTATTRSQAFRWAITTSCRASR
jgi:molybdopterin-biosynthesis enzyme MoeA-like protein